MNKELKRKWVDALRSGEYEQCANALTDGKGYCCLGVLYKLAHGREPPPLLQHGDNCWYWFGIAGSTVDELAGVNDFGVPFEMIAGLIDEAL